MTPEMDHRYIMACKRMSHTELSTFERLALSSANTWQSGCYRATKASSAGEMMMGHDLISLRLNASHCNCSRAVRSRFDCGRLQGQERELRVATDRLKRQKAAASEREVTPETRKCHGRHREDCIASNTSVSAFSTRALLGNAHQHYCDASEDSRRM